MKKLFLILFILISTLFSQTIIFQSGWNFVGFKSNLTITQDATLNNANNVQISWTYTNNNTGKRWNAFSPDTEVATKINQFQYNTIERIENYEGVWIYAKKAFEYSQSTETLESPSIPGSEYYAGWNLLSSPTGEAIDPSTLTNASRVFVYRDGQWFGHFNDGTTSIDGVGILTTIGATEAYWVYHGVSSATGTTGESGTSAIISTEKLAVG